MIRSVKIACLFAVASMPPLGGQTPGMPKLRHAFTTTDIDLSPINRLTPIAVGPQGHVLFVSSAGSSALRMALVDSTGKLVRRLGQTGGGPGEVGEPQPVEVGKDRVSVWDRANAVFLEWDLKGTLLQSVKPTRLSGVSFVSAEVVGMTKVARGWQVVALNRTTGQLRELIPTADTFITAHFGLLSGAQESRYAPVPGVWSQGFVVADAGNYAVALYRWDGSLVRVLHRELAPTHASAGRIDDFFANIWRLQHLKIAPRQQRAGVGDGAGVAG